MLVTLTGNVHFDIFLQFHFHCVIANISDFFIDLSDAKSFFDDFQLFYLQFYLATCDHNYVLLCFYIYLKCLYR